MLTAEDHIGFTGGGKAVGGGVVGGRVIGSTDKNGAYPSTDPQIPENLAATIYETLGIPKSIMWQDTLGRPHHVYHGEPIRGLT